MLRALIRAHRGGADRLELCGNLSEEHVAGKAGEAGVEGGAEYRDVGIWSEEQWTLLANKTLGAMSEPGRLISRRLAQS